LHRRLASSQFDGGAGITEFYSDGNAMGGDVGRPERCPHEVAVSADMARSSGGAVQERVRLAAIFAASGGDRTAQEERPVHRENRRLIHVRLAGKPLGMMDSCGGAAIRVLASEQAMHDGAGAACAGQLIA
jgi:hypothetical protein